MVHCLKTFPEHHVRVYSPIVMFLFVVCRFEKSGVVYLQLAFAVVKLFYTCLYTAWVNDESKKPVLVLNSIPSAHYNSEVLCMCVVYKRLTKFLL